MRFLKRGEEDYSMQLTPLIDVVFLLLIFFMVSTAFVDFTKQLEIELPEAKAGAVGSETKVFTIEITSAGAIFIDGKSVTIEEIPIEIAVKQGEKRSVVIRADKRLHYGLAVEIMGICKKSGISDIGLAIL